MGQKYMLKDTSYLVLKIVSRCHGTSLVVTEDDTQGRVCMVLLAGFGCTQHPSLLLVYRPTDLPVENKKHLLIS